MARSIDTALRLAVPAAATALLAACATQPAYPIAPGGSAGASGRGEAVRPQYPIAPAAAAQARAGGVDVPLATTPAPAATSPAAEDTGPRVAVAPVDSSELAPSTSPPVAAPAPVAAPQATVASPGVGYVELRRREAERAHAEAVERRRRAVAAKAKSYLPEKHEPGVRTYTLAKGDTLYGVGRRFGVSPKAVADENDLKLSGTLHPGAEISLPEDATDGRAQAGAKGRYVTAPGKLIAPTRAERAAALAKAERAVPPVPDLAPEPVETAAAQPPSQTAPPPVTAAPVTAPATVVATSAAPRPATAVRPAPTTLATVPPPARVYAPAPPTSVAAVTSSGPRPYASLGPQGAGRVQGATLPSSRSGGRTAADAQAAFRVAAAREAAREGGGEATSAASYPPATPVAAAPSGRGRFVWPVRGAVLSTFGPKGPGQRNDGVDIAATDGEAVRAAASGEVVYAGHDVAALGNLVAVKHADGWVTIYANLQRITVHPREHVAQGGEVGLAGASGDASRPQVHFEVRYAPSAADKARPVDPQTVLPALGAAG